MNRVLQSSRHQTSSYPYTITLLTSSNRKAAEVKEIVGDAVEVGRVSAELLEVQETDEIKNLRMQGPQCYPEAAKISLIKKYRSFTEAQSSERGATIRLQPGFTIMDSAWFQVARQGLPGITAKQEFDDGVNGEGVKIPNISGPRTACAAAKEFRDCRAVWIETAATIEADPTDGNRFIVVYRQEVAECFIPPTPRGSGWAYDVCCCPDPIEYARFLGKWEQAETLSAISDRQWKLALEADKLGLLVTFAELESRGQKQRFSPRAALFKQFVAPKEEQRWPS
jgi:hypothetical protein